MENKYMAHLSADCYGREFFAIPGYFHQYRLGGNIIIPQVMMNHLEIPNHFSGGSAERDNRITIQVLSQPFTAIIIRTWATGRNKYQITFRINRNYGPGIGRPGLMCLETF